MPGREETVLPHPSPVRSSAKKSPTASRFPPFSTCLSTGDQILASALTYTLLCCFVEPRADSGDEQ